MMANLSITTAWNETASFVKREARLLFPLAFMLVALPVALTEALAPAPLAPGEFPEAGSWLVLIPIVLVASLVGNVAISWLALRPGASVGEALARGGRRFLALFGAALLLFLLVGLLFFVVAVIMTLVVPGAMSAASAGRQTPALATAALLTMLLLLPVLLFLGTRLMLTTPTAAAEEGGSLAILRRSWRLTSGHAIKLFLFLLLVAILLGVLATAVESVAGILFAILAGPPEPGSLSALLTIIVMAVLNTLVTAYLTSLIARIYAQLAAPSGQEETGGT